MTRQTRHIISLSILLFILAPNILFSQMMMAETDTIRTNFIEIDYPIYHAKSIDDVDSLYNKEIKIKNQSSNLKAEGSISREVQVSGASNISVNSGTDLMISGELMPQVMFKGLIRESQIPLQPMGNTQALRDYDKILLEVTSPSIHLFAGDVDYVASSNLSPLKRQFQGIQANYINDNMSAESYAGFTAYERHTAFFNGQDGKQGPYRLYGKNGERQVIIIAGTESIWIDGKLLTRGKTNDYIIDYNSAEVDFMIENPISNETKIQVAYQYISDPFLGAIGYAKNHLGARIEYRPVSSINVGLKINHRSDDARHPLGNISPDSLEIIFNSHDVENGKVRISTAILDTILGEYDLNMDQQYVYVGEGNGLYRVLFQYVGTGKGVYRKSIEAGHTIYSFDPVGGDYVTYRTWQAPETSQIISGMTEINVQHFKSKIEYSLMQKIANTYNIQFEPEVRNAFLFSNEIMTKYVNLSGNYRYLSEGYVPFDNLNPLEYYYKWQLNPRIAEMEKWLNTKLFIGDSLTKHISFQIEQLSRDDEGKRLRGNISSHYTNRHHVLLDANAALFRQNDLTQDEMNIQLTMPVLNESNRLSLATNWQSASAVPLQIYQPSSFTIRGEYQLIHKYVQSNLHILNRREAGLNEQYSLNQTLRDWKKNRQEFGLGIKSNKTPNQSFILASSLREVETLDSIGTNKQRFLLGKMKYNGRFFDEHLNISTDYETNEEHLPQYDYYYLPVDSGFGNHSYDPVIHDYIPTPGGRFIQQRLYSDVEQQVRSSKGKYHVKYKYSLIHNEIAGLNTYDIQLSYRNDVRQSLDQNKTLMENSSIYGNLILSNSKSNQQWYRVYMSNALSKSQMHTSGLESRINQRKGIEGKWTLSRDLRVNLVYEKTYQEKEMAFNIGLNEKFNKHQLSSVVENHFKIPGKVKLAIDYGQVQEISSEHSWDEMKMKIQISPKLNRRSILRLEGEYSKINGYITHLLYSYFDGRQVGVNTKYSLDGQFRLSSRLMLTLNSSIMQRGDNSPEKYLQLKGKMFF